MTTVWVKIIRNKETGRREVFRIMRENYVPDGWKLDSVLETFTIGGPLPYGENNPYIRAKREKEARENRRAMAFCVAMAAAVILFVIAVVVSVEII